ESPVSEAKKVETFRGVAYPWHCDSMGHMNTQHYCALFDGATFHFLALLGGPRLLKETKRGWADAKQTIEYRREILSGDLLVVSTAMTRVGRSSIGFRHELTDLEDGELRATSDHVTVHFDLANRVSLPLTADMLSKTKEYLDGHSHPP
ncbi:MAG: acyl-CoA thioesterase, partial [Aestuariivirga sp.]|uniref:acyl-CoA thioesterase n=1 Tax=Aestuariivirga sp. TaxID=2650926 RepID=UPI003016614E